MVVWWVIVVNGKLIFSESDGMKGGRKERLAKYLNIKENKGSRHGGVGKTVCSVWKVYEKRETGYEGSEEGQTGFFNFLFINI